MAKRRKLTRKPDKIFLSKIGITNYKGWKNSNEIKLGSRVNLIFGKNSSGKSTILQSLRLFRQSYGTGNLTPINLESPSDLKNRGGLDIEGGWNEDPDIRIFNLYNPQPWHDNYLEIVPNMKYVSNLCKFYVPLFEKVEKPYMLRGSKIESFI